MKLLSARNHHLDDSETVSNLNSKKTFNLKPSETVLNKKNSIDCEIERSLYFLGKALYRFSLLQKERSKND